MQNSYLFLSKGDNLEQLKHDAPKLMVLYHSKNNAVVPAEESAKATTVIQGGKHDAISKMSKYKLAMENNKLV